MKEVAPSPFLCIEEKDNTFNKKEREGERKGKGEKGEDEEEGERGGRNHVMKIYDVPSFLLSYTGVWSIFLVDGNLPTFSTK